MCVPRLGELSQSNVCETWDDLVRVVLHCALQFCAQGVCPALRCFGLPRTRRMQPRVVCTLGSALHLRRCACLTMPGIETARQATEAQLRSQRVGCLVGIHLGHTDAQQEQQPELAYDKQEAELRVSL